MQRRLAFGRELHLHGKAVGAAVDLALLAHGLRRVLGGGDESLDPGVLKGAAARCLRVRAVVGVCPVLRRLLPGKALRLRRDLAQQRVVLRLVVPQAHQAVKRAPVAVYNAEIIV